MKNRKKKGEEQLLFSGFANSMWPLPYHLFSGPQNLGACMHVSQPSIGSNSGSASGSGAGSGTVMAPSPRRR